MSARVAKFVKAKTSACKSIKQKEEEAANSVSILTRSYCVGLIVTGLPQVFFLSWAQRHPIMPPYLPLDLLGTILVVYLASERLSLKPKTVVIEIVKGFIYGYLTALLCIRVLNEIPEAWFLVQL